jgi:hypothetical protein
MTSSDNTTKPTDVPEAASIDQVEHRTGCQHVAEGLDQGARHGR